MPVYEYKCGEGHVTLETHGRDDSYVGLPGRCCGMPVKRKYSISFAPVWQEHFNHSTGSPISDPKQFSAKLRELSDRQTEHTGIPHDYQPSDPSYGMED